MINGNKSFKKVHLTPFKIVFVLFLAFIFEKYSASVSESNNLSPAAVVAAPGSLENILAS